MSEVSDVCEVWNTFEEIEHIVCSFGRCGWEARADDETGKHHDEVEVVLRRKLPGFLLRHCFGD